MGASLADAAVSDDVITFAETGFAFVDVFEAFSGEEGSVFGVDGAGPGDGFGSGDVAAPEGAFVGVAVHVEAFAGEFLRAADVDELAGFFDVGEDVLAEGPLSGVVADGGGVSRVFGCGDFAGELAAFFFPLGATAVHDGAVGVAEELEHPEGVAGPPVVFVAVEDDLGVFGGTDAGHQFFKFFFAQVVADDGVIEVVGPVDFVSSGDVSAGVEERVFVGFDYDHVFIVEVVGHPLGVHQIFGMYVSFFSDFSHDLPVL